jgi:hypothetical protein
VVLAPGPAPPAAEAAAAAAAVVVVPWLALGHTGQLAQWSTKPKYM